MTSTLIRKEKGGRRWPPVSNSTEASMANKVKVQAIRPFFGVYGKVKPGQVVEVSEAHAKRFVDRGLAIPDGYKAAKAPKNKMEGAPANKASANPSKASQDGGQTGAAKPSSSSPAVPASKTSRSTKSKDGAE